MRTIIIKCDDYADFLAARATLGDWRVNYTIGMDEETSYVVFTVNFIRYIFVKKALEREIDRGARFSIVETA